MQWVLIAWVLLNIFSFIRVITDRPIHEWTNRFGYSLVGKIPYLISVIVQLPAILLGWLVLAIRNY